jgi:PTS system nitrogen regulatory IIA component
MTIGDYLSPDGVVFLDGADRAGAARALIDRAATHDRLGDEEEFSRAIFERESILSTAVGQGVAVPHAKVTGISDFFVTVGVSRTPIEWDAPDGEPVRLVFLIGGPADQQTRYLQILAKVMLVVKNAGLRSRLLEAASAQDVIDTFTGV